MLSITLSHLRSRISKRMSIFTMILLVLTRLNYRVWVYHRQQQPTVITVMKLAAPQHPQIREHRQYHRPH